MASVGSLLAALIAEVHGDPGVMGGVPWDQLPAEDRDVYRLAAAQAVRIESDGHLLVLHKTDGSRRRYDGRRLAWLR